MNDSVAIDVPVIQLRPLRERKVSKREYDRILASIKAVGLIEPLVVFPENGDYLILDGVQRYHALVELGVVTAPCIMGAQREAFTSTRHHAEGAGAAARPISTNFPSLLKSRWPGLASRASSHATRHCIAARTPPPGTDPQWPLGIRRSVRAAAPPSGTPRPARLSAGVAW